MEKATSVQSIFDNICSVFNADKAQGDKALIRFNLSGDNGGTYWVKIDTGTCDAGSGEPTGTPDMTIVASAEDWLAVSNGELKAMNAFMAGKIKVQGNMGMALKLTNWFNIGG
jgi:putative sterol carrier protein